jgi:hypothetical protein
LGHLAKLARTLLAITLPLAWCSAQAQDLEGPAIEAAVADGVSSAAVLMTGAIPVSPLLPLMAVGMKAMTFQYTRGLPEHEKPAAYAAATAMWSGAAVNNVCMTASFLTGGGFLPACVAIGFAWGMKSWNDSEPGRQFPGNCAVMRQFMYDPAPACTPPAPRQVAEATRSMISAQELTAP